MIIIDSSNKLAAVSNQIFFFFHMNLSLDDNLTMALATKKNFCLFKLTQTRTRIHANGFFLFCFNQISIIFIYLFIYLFSLRPKPRFSHCHLSLDKFCSLLFGQFRSRSFIHSLFLTCLCLLCSSMCNQLPDNLSRFLRVFFNILFIQLYNHFPNDYTLNSSNFLHFFTNNNWIVAPYLLSAHFSVIKLAVMFVTVPVHRAEESTTSTLKT